MALCKFKTWGVWLPSRLCVLPWRAGSSRLPADLQLPGSRAGAGCHLPLSLGATELGCLQCRRDSPCPRGGTFPALQGRAVPILTPARELHPFQTVGEAELCSFPPLWHILKLAIPFWILSAHSPSSPQGPAFFQYSSHVAYFYSVEQL